MYSATQNLRAERTGWKLESGHTPAQITIMLGFNTVTRKINNNMDDSRESFVRGLQENLILSQVENLAELDTLRTMTISLH